MLFFQLGDAIPFLSLGMHGDALCRHGLQGAFSLRISIVDMAGFQKVFTLLLFTLLLKSMRPCYHCSL